MCEKVIILVGKIFRQVIACARGSINSDRLVLISLSFTLGRAESTPGVQTITHLNAPLEKVAYPTRPGGRMYTKKAYFS